MDQRFPNAAPHAQLIEFVQDRPGHDLRYAIDAKTLRAELGWSPSRNFPAGLTETVDWYLGHENWLRAVSSRLYAGERLGLADRLAS